jgi:hypothetical protein
MRGRVRDLLIGLKLLALVGRILMPNVEVNCSVANCFFHAEGNICGADRIKIDMDHQSKYDTEFSQDFDDFKNRTEEASHSANTCCKTFKPNSK